MAVKVEDKFDKGCKYADKYLRKKGIEKKSKCVECPFYPDIARKCIFEYRKLFTNNRHILKRDIQIKAMYKNGVHIKDISNKFGLKSKTVRKILGR